VCKLIIIVPTVKFVLHDSLACKIVCCGGYLSGGKRQVYHAGKIPNLPPTYLLTNPFDPALLLDIRSTNRKSGDEALAKPVTTIF
jgi:hypothetical protein